MKTDWISIWKPKKMFHFFLSPILKHSYGASWGLLTSLVCILRMAVYRVWAWTHQHHVTSQREWCPLLIEAYAHSVFSQLYFFVSLFLHRGLQHASVLPVQAFTFLNNEIIFSALLLNLTLFLLLSKFSVVLQELQCYPAFRELTYKSSK